MGPKSQFQDWSSGTNCRACVYPLVSAAIQHSIAIVLTDIRWKSLPDRRVWIHLEEWQEFRIEQLCEGQGNEVTLLLSHATPGEEELKANGEGIMINTT